MEAATPTSQSQQQRQRQPQHVYTITTSQSLFQDRPQTRSAPDVFGAVSEAHMASHLSPPASQGRSPPLRRTVSLGLPQRPSGGPSTRISGNLSRFSVASLSETMDDKLHEALLKLENGGAEVGDALARQQREPAVLLGAMEDELSGPRATSADEGQPPLLASPPTRWESERRCTADDGAPPQHQSSRRSAKRAGRSKTSGNADARGRRSGSHKSGVDGEEDWIGSRKHRRASSAGESLSQSLRREGEADGVSAAPPLTRADVKRLRLHQPAQEDSQVVFFDH